MVFYLFISIYQPARNLKRIREQVKRAALDEIIETVLRSHTKNSRSAYERTIIAAENIIQSWESDSNDGAVEREDSFLPFAEEQSEEERRAIDEIDHIAIPRRGPSYSGNPFIGMITIKGIVGILFILGAIFIGVSGINAYSQQLQEKSWIPFKAVVTDVIQRKESGNAENSIKTVYDITYRYRVNGDSHTGKIIGTVTYKAVNDTVDIKYNPESPERSTNILAPRPEALLYNLIGSFAFAAVGLWLAGLLPFLIKPKKNSV